MTGRPQTTGRPRDNWTSRPPFLPDNLVALKHGADSARTFGPLAEELAEAIKVDAPWLSRRSFAASVRAWSVVEAQAQLVDAYLDRHGLLDEAGEPRPAAALADRLHSRAMRLRASLGVDPTSFARLLATLGATSGHPDASDALSALQAEGRQILATRALRAAAGSLGSGEVGPEGAA